MYARHPSPPGAPPMHPRCTPTCLTPPRSVAGRPRPTYKVSALSSWKLCECIETDRDRDRDRQTILYIDIDISSKFLNSSPLSWSKTDKLQICENLYYFNREIKLSSIKNKPIGPYWKPTCTYYYFIRKIHNTTYRIAPIPRSMQNIFNSGHPTANQSILSRLSIYTYVFDSVKKKIEYFNLNLTVQYHNSFDIIYVC